VSYDDILFERADGVATLTINRPENGNMFRHATLTEMAEALRTLRDDPAVRVGVVTGAGDRFFCLGGEHEPFEGLDHSVVLPVVEVYELIDSIPKPVVAAVNGFAVGGGNVLHTVCDLTIASDRAVFRQVGPLVGSFDAGFGTWHLEEAIGRKRAKEMWYLNRKYDAAQALAMGLVNEVVPHEKLRQRVGEIAEELKLRGPQALAGLKAAFSAKHAGVAGQARLAHDLLLTHYLLTEEAAELSASFSQKRPPDQTRFNR
jgi:naphthoate synthase